MKQNKKIHPSLHPTVFPAHLSLLIATLLYSLLGCSGLKLKNITIPTVPVSGRILDSSSFEDLPVQAAWVVVNGSSAAITDLNGNFTVNAPVPTQEQKTVRVFLSVAKHGYTARVEQLQINTDAPTELQPVFISPAADTGTIKGRVLDKLTRQGIPDAEVLLAIEGGVSLRIRTASDGSFLLSGIIEGQRNVRCRSAEYLVTNRTITVQRGDENFNPEVIIELLPLGSPATVSGTVVSAETLLPVANAKVRIGDKQGTTDANGDFSIDEAPTGNQIVQVEHLDFERFIDTITIVGDPIVIFLNPPGSLPPPAYNLTGKVTLQGETNHSGVRVEAIRRSNGQVIDATTTTVEGNYFLWLPADTYLVRASMEGFQPSEQEVTIRLGVAVKDVNFTLIR